MCCAAVNDGKDVPEATAGNPLPNLSSRPQSIHLSKPQPPERASLSDFKDLSAETALLLQQQQQRGEVAQWKKGGPDWLSPELKGSDIVKHMLLAKRSGSSNQQLKRAEPIASQQLRNAEYKNTTGQCFFVVELIDPQVNFLDVKTHSSLIIVAGHSSLEGRRSAQAWTSSRYVEPLGIIASFLIPSSQCHLFTGLKQQQWRRKRRGSRWSCCGWTTCPPSPCPALLQLISRGISSTGR